MHYIAMTNTIPALVILKVRDGLQAKQTEALLVEVIEFIGVQLLLLERKGELIDCKLPFDALSKELAQVY